MRIILLLLCCIVALMSQSLNEKLVIGKSIYEKECQSCHGLNGKEGSLTFLVKPKRLTSLILTQKQIFNVIKEGPFHWGSTSKVMPAFKLRLTNQEIQSVSSYVIYKFARNQKQRLKLSLEKALEVSQSQQKMMLKKGENIYHRNCSWCHGKKGRGNGIAKEKSSQKIFPRNLTKSQLSEHQIFLYVKYGGKYWGSYMDTMPSWQQKYNDYDLRSVAKYINQIIRK